MAEFCLECFNQLLENKKLKEKDVVLSIDLCENCGEWKPCIVKIKRKKLIKERLFNKIKIFLKKSRY